MLDTWEEETCVRVRARDREGDGVAFGRSVLLMLVESVG